MKTKILTAIAFIIVSFTSNAQVGIGTSTPHSSAALDITSTNKALLISRVATTSSILSPVNGMMIYDISSNSFKSYQGNAWSSLGVPATTNDLIYSALTNATSQANYNAAGINTWVQVIASEYQSVATIAGAAKYGFNDAIMNTAGDFDGGDVTISSNPTVPTYGANLPSSNYVIGLSFVPKDASKTNNGFKFKYHRKATPTSGLVDYPNSSTFTNPGAVYVAGVRVYYILKKPTVTTPATGPFLLAGYTQANLILNSATTDQGTGSYSSSDVTSSSEVQGAAPFRIQVIGTATKSW